MTKGKIDKNITTFVHTRTYEKDNNGLKQIIVNPSRRNSLQKKCSDLGYYLKEGVNIEIEKIEGINYIVHNLTEGTLRPPGRDIHKLIAVSMSRLMPFSDSTLILGIESMGIPLATLLSYEMDIPWNVIRKDIRNFANHKDVIEVSCPFRFRSFSAGKPDHFYIPKINKDDKIILVDDIMETGGTIKAVADGIIDKSPGKLQAIFIFMKIEDSPKIEEVKKDGTQKIYKTYTTRETYRDVPLVRIYDLSVYADSQNPNKVVIDAIEPSYPGEIV